MTNITLTAAALAVAVKIRLIEGHYSLRGAVGSSPYVVHMLIDFYLNSFV